MKINKKIKYEDLKNLNLEPYLNYLESCIEKLFSREPNGKEILFPAGVGV